MRRNVSRLSAKDNVAKLADCVREAATRLARVGVPSPQADAELIWAHIFGISRGEVLARGFRGDEVSAENVDRANVLLGRREKREPLQHLLGVAPFMSFEVAVGPGVFVPRPETESLVERAIQLAQTLGVGEAGISVLDLCAGSGVVAIAIAREVPWARVTAVEASESAVAYLSKNVARLAPAVRILHSTVDEFGITLTPGSLDLVVSNPPYVPLGETPNEPEVSEYDPPEALFGGADGMDVVVDVVSLAKKALRPGGVVMIEHANVQGDSVRNLLVQAGFRLVVTERDLLGRDRFTHAVAG
jgi:release factor glutamine methyltransferase